jgi:hypothetical protein
MSTTRKRPSKASVLRNRQRLKEQQAHKPELDPKAAELIDSYTSKTLAVEDMPVIRPFMRRVIETSDLTGLESIRNHRTHIAALAGYALHRGLPLEPAVVLTTSFIDEYISTGMAGFDDHVRAERRRRLLNLARNVNPGPDCPARLTPIAHVSVRAPYTPAELAVITRVALVQPTPAKARQMCAAVGGGAGAGAAAVDYRHLRVGAIHDLGDLGVEIHMPGPRPRVVPVRRSLEHLVRFAIADRPAHQLLLGRDEDRRNTAARAVENAALYRVPAINQARLRSTWLADLMTDSVPIGVLMRAAGLQSARTLVDLLPHLDPWLEAKGLRQASTDDSLRGAR